MELGRMYQDGKSFVYKKKIQKRGFVIHHLRYRKGETVRRSEFPKGENGRDEYHRKLKGNNAFDLVCIDCGKQLTSSTSFKKHKKSKCEYVPKTRPKKTNIVLQTNDNSNIANIANDNTISITINNHNLFKIVPHSKEFESMDKPKVLGKIIKKVMRELKEGLSHNNNICMSALRDSFYITFVHVFANEDYPEFQNLYVDDEKTLRMKIYDGEQYVDDEMLPVKRMVEINMIVSDMMKWIIENSEEKKEGLKKLLWGKVDNNIKYNMNDPYP